jgi:hypothetical protein
MILKYQMYQWFQKNLLLQMSLKYQMYLLYRLSP